MNILQPFKVLSSAQPLVSRGPDDLAVREGDDPDVILDGILVAGKDIDGDVPFGELHIEGVEVVLADMVDLDVVLEYLVRGVDRHSGLMAEVPDMVVAVVEMVVGVEEDIDMADDLSHYVVRNEFPVPAVEVHGDGQIPGPEKHSAVV